MRKATVDVNTFGAYMTKRDRILLGIFTIFVFPMIMLGIGQIYYEILCLIVEPFIAASVAGIMTVIAWTIASMFAAEKVFDL